MCIFWSLRTIWLVCHFFSFTGTETVLKSSDYSRVQMVILILKRVQTDWLGVTQLVTDTPSHTLWHEVDLKNHNFPISQSITHTMSGYPANILGIRNCVAWSRKHFPFINCLFDMIITLDFWVDFSVYSALYGIWNRNSTKRTWLKSPIANSMSGQQQAGSSEASSKLWLQMALLLNMKTHFQGRVNEKCLLCYKQKIKHSIIWILKIDKTSFLRH